MKPNETPKMKADEASFLATLTVVLLLILPALGERMGKYGGGVAMLAVSAIGLVAYFFLFGARLRNRGQAKTVAVLVAASFGVSAGVALALPLVRGLGH